MKVFGINNYQQNSVYGANKTNNVQKNNFLNFLGTKPLKTLSHDTVSFGMKGSGKVNDMQDLVAYVGRDNAMKILNTLKKCRYSKADILKSCQTKMIGYAGEVYLTNFNSVDNDDKLRGNCRELMLKAGKEIKENCPDLNIYGMGIFNEEYKMTHCVLAIAKKDTLEDSAIKNEVFDEDNEILVVDPSFRTYKMEKHNPKNLIVNINTELEKQRNYYGVEKLNLNERIVLDSYKDIAQDLNLPPLNKKFGEETKPPLLVIYFNGKQAACSIASIEQKNDNSIIEFAVNNLKPYMNKFMANL